MTEHDACVALNLISGIGYAKYSALTEAFGGAAACFGRSEAELSQVRGIGRELSARLAGFSSDDLESELNLTERAGVHLVTLADATYPEILRGIADPPLALYIRGKLDFDGDNAVAVVGSRRMSQYGERMARAMATDAAGAGFVVISGLAYGVDAVAHAAAMEAGGITVAVLGGGLLRVHPQEHVPLARRIVETGGAVISEFPMEFPVSRTSFPRRNRIVSGLSRATIVIEAGVESGAMITANLALEQGRDVYAVPGHADNPQAAGCHKLIRNGATLAENFQQVLEDFNSGLFGPLKEGSSARVDCAADLRGDERIVYDAVGAEPTRLDVLVGKCGNLETGRILTALMALEMKLLIRRGADRGYSR